MRFETFLSGYHQTEGPRVDDENRLYFAELGLKAPSSGVYRRDPDGRITCLVAGRKAVGGLLLTRSGGLLLTGRTLALWTDRGGLVDIWSQWEGKPMHLLGDLTADAEGRVYVGTWGYDIVTVAEQATDMAAIDMASIMRPGALFRIDPPGTVTKLWDGIEGTNGLGFSPDGARLYHVDTPTKAIWVYDVTAGGGIKDRRVFARLDAGSMDGLTVDVEGGVWAAVNSGPGEIVRFRSDGTLDRRIKVPATMVSGIEFGGADHCDIYITTFDNTEDPERRGTIFRMRSDVPGMPSPKAAF